jgi:hypothetical protein
MAILTAKAESSSGFQIDELAPSGDYVATCIDIADEFQVPRRKYQSEEMEDTDVTRFLFGLKGQDGKLYKVQTFEMKISGSPKSSLYKFLTAWLGKPPEYGWDYCTLKGQGAVISVEHVVSQMGTTYPKISRISPAKTSLADYSAQVIPLTQFAQTQAPTPVPASPTPTPPTIASAPAAWNPQADNEADCPF